MGIFALRWFILGDGTNYGLGDDAPHPDPTKEGEWRFADVDPPKLTESFEEDFRWLLQKLEITT